MLSENHEIEGSFDLIALVVTTLPGFTALDTVVEEI